MMSIKSIHAERDEPECCEVGEVFGNCYGECGCDDCAVEGAIIAAESKGELIAAG